MVVDGAYGFAIYIMGCDVAYKTVSRWGPGPVTSLPILPVEHFLPKLNSPILSLQSQSCKLAIGFDWESYSISARPNKELGIWRAPQSSVTVNCIFPSARTSRDMLCTDFEMVIWTMKRHVGFDLCIWFNDNTGGPQGGWFPSHPLFLLHHIHCTQLC